MAQKKKTSSPKQKKTSSDEASNVTRIKAESSRSSAKTKQPKAVKATAVEAKKTKKERTPKEKDERGYFKGAWYELRQVRWPNRRTTWALTLAVLLFTAFFVVLIVVLDYGFQWAFDQLLGEERKRL